MTIEELRIAAAEVARALRESDSPTKDVRSRFIAVRSELFQRGLFDPVLARFDTITGPRAAPQQVADELEALAETLR